ncbi:MAG: hypothetical protein HY257_04205 [Chloroflexi bacterium]|nr:hypothetical protein [Chloroflexota bacterium]
MNNRRANMLVIAISIVIALSAATFILLHTTSPFDGAHLQPGERVWKSNGVQVTPLATSRAGLQRGDIVIAVEGKSIEAWVRALLSVNSARPAWKIGQTVVYTVERDGNRVEVPIILRAYSLAEIFNEYWGMILFAFASQVLGTFVFLRRPNETSARLLFLWAWSGSNAYGWSLGLSIGDIVGGAGYWVYSLLTPGAWILYWAAIFHFALIFPTKTWLTRFPSIERLLYVFPFAFLFMALAATIVGASNWSEWMQVPRTVEYIVAAFFLALIVLNGIWRQRTLRDPDARAKLKWLAFGGFVAGAGGLVTWVLPLLIFGAPLIPAAALGVLVLVFPISISIGILRHRLFDIDIIIRRTLIYGALTAILVTFYFAGVIAFQQIFRILTGQTSDLAIIVSTLSIAALFNPLRGRVQNAIDRAFYRRKYDAAHALARFAQTARDEVKLDKLSARLEEIVAETMQPTHVSLWLRKK